MPDAERAFHQNAPKGDVRATALLVELNVVDARIAGLEGWRIWRMEASSVLVVLTMWMMGLSYKDPVGLLISGPLIIGPLLGFVIRRRLLRSALRLREQVLARHEEVLTLAAEYPSTPSDEEVA